MRLLILAIIVGLLGGILQVAHLRALTPDVGQLTPQEQTNGISP